ncbi:MAG: hypothetical protein HYZ18_16185 [Pseudogulbenkiania sp.]|nr:hypothetical protein [Pseudogulbenkiania sp.]
MNPSQKASPPAGLELELPVLTEVVDDAALPVLTEEPAFELPDFDFSGELDEMAAALPADAMELEMPPELSLEAVLDIGPAPEMVESGVDFSRLPSLDLDVASLDELALDDVLPGLKREVPPQSVSELATGTVLGDEPFDFLRTPAGSGAESVARAPSEPVLSPDDGIAIPELTMEWSEPTVSVEAEEGGVSSPESVELQSTEPVQVQDDGFDIPELAMEWSEPTASAEAEEVGSASSDPVEPPSAGSIPSLAEGDAVAVETSTVVPEPWAGAIPTLDATLADELAEPVTGTPAESETAAAPFAMQAESADMVVHEAEEVVWPVPAVQSIDIESLPTGVLGGGVGPEPEAESIHDQLPWDGTEYDGDAAESPEAVAAALSELAALLEPASEVMLPEPAASLVPESRGTELPVTEVSPQPAGVGEEGGGDESMLFDEPDHGDQPGQPEIMAVVSECLSPAATVEQAVTVEAESSVESEGLQVGVTPEVPMLAEQTGPADVPQEPLGIENDEAGVFGVGSASDSGGSEAAALDYPKSDLDEMHAVAGIEPADVVVPLIQGGAVQELGELAVVPQLEAAASTGLPEPSVASAMPVAGGSEHTPGAMARSCTVVDEQALIDSLTQKILPRMKVELSLWLQDALEMQARQMLSGLMHQLKEDYEMLFNETLRESLRQAITEIGRDEREGKL